MEYTKETINGVEFTAGSSKYRVVYPGTHGTECDLYHFHDGGIRMWKTIAEFNSLVKREQFVIVEQPSLYPIF